LEGEVAVSDNEGYWIERHERLGVSLASVGKIGTPEHENLARYARKKRRIMSLLRALGMQDLTGKAVLDAGCGIGEMSELFYAMGAKVSGIDASPKAIDFARCRAPDSGAFSSGSLTDFTFNCQFDVIFCLDVLYHVVDDDNWRRTLSRVRAHLAPGGTLIIFDQLKREPTHPGEHVRFRTLAMYDEALSELTRVTIDGFEFATIYRNEPLA
jgi:2-polyprenyl-3-methyl-5-hydroxy-6-metoxy-1,4-benzoquinol methylase